MSYHDSDSEDDQCNYYNRDGNRCSKDSGDIPGPSCTLCDTFFCGKHSSCINDVGLCYHCVCEGNTEKDIAFLEYQGKSSVSREERHLYKNCVTCENYYPIKFFDFFTKRCEMCSVENLKDKEVQMECIHCDDTIVIYLYQPSYGENSVKKYPNLHQECPESLDGERKLCLGWRHA